MNEIEDKAKEFLKKLVSHTTLYKGTIDELEVYEPDDVIWAYKEGYHQAEKDVKEELSNLFQEFMLDCIKDDTETHILHFMDVFKNKLKEIGNE